MELRNWKVTSDGKKTPITKSFMDRWLWAEMNSNVVVMTIKGPIPRRMFGGINPDQCILREG